MVLHSEQVVILCLVGLGLATRLSWFAHQRYPNNGGPLMIDLLAYDFMQRSLQAAALVGALCWTIWVFVVLRGLAFMGAGTANRRSGI